MCASTHMANVMIQPFQAALDNLVRPEFHPIFMECRADLIKARKELYSAHFTLNAKIDNLRKENTKVKAFPPRKQFSPAENEALFSRLRAVDKEEVEKKITSLTGDLSKIQNKAAQAFAPLSAQGFQSGLANTLFTPNEYVKAFQQLVPTLIQSIEMEGENKRNLITIKKMSVDARAFLSNSLLDLGITSGKLEKPPKQSSSNEAKHGDADMNDDEKDVKFKALKKPRMKQATSSRQKSSVKPSSAKGKSSSQTSKSSGNNSKRNPEPGSMKNRSDQLQHKSKSASMKEKSKPKPTFKSGKMKSSSKTSLKKQTSKKSKRN